VQVPPNENYVPGLLNRVQHATALLSFTAVGYGTGERFPIPGQGTGPANPNDPNDATLRIRYIAARLSYNAYNPTTDVLRLSQNIALGENGTCTGDSGGPIFHEDDSRGRVQVSVTSGGDNVCRATSAGPAFSRQEAFDFLSCARIEGDASSVIKCVERTFGVGSAPK
jgi:secreted trypsin-like serine protease